MERGRDIEREREREKEKQRKRVIRVIRVIRKGEQSRRLDEWDVNTHV